MSETITGQLECTSSSTSSTFIWKIEHFSTKCSQVGEFIFSPILKFGDCNSTACPTWRLKLYPFGNVEECKDYLSVYLHFIPQPMLKEYVCSWAVSIHDGTQIDNSTKHDSSKFEKFTSVTSRWGWNKFIKRSNLLANSLLKQGTLIIACSIYDTSLKTLSQCTSYLAKSDESMYLSGDFSDATIVIDDKKINVHKAILSARSKVFSAMFKNDMAEANTNEIIISDIEYTVMDKFLLFLYSGKVEDIEKFALSLLPVANKYDMNELKRLCEFTLSNSITIDNACKMLSTADLYNCIRLRDETMDFIASKAKEIIKTQGFEDLSESNLALFREMVCKVVEYNCE